MEEKKLWKFIKRNTKPGYQASVTDEGKPVDNVANQGLEMGRVAVRGSGEYNGLAIRALEDIKPCLTDLRVSKAVRLLSEGNIQGAIIVLRISDEVMSNGIGLLYGVLKRWLEQNELPMPTEYANKAIELADTRLARWVGAVSFAPIIGRFEIVDIGFSKRGHPVVPESWLGRVFNDADELHREMDQLEWRRGLPPVNFCAIYAMHLRQETRWAPVSDELRESLASLDVRVAVTMFPTIRRGVLETLNSGIHFFGGRRDREYKRWLSTLPPSARTMTSHLHNGTDPNAKILLACDLDLLVERTPQYQRTKNVGLLVSTLQKLNRRGRGCSGALAETLTQLWRSPGYNLPEQQFLRVNACRQLAWRTFITTIEDVEAFAMEPRDPSTGTTYLSMSDLACLATLANIHPDVQFTEPVFHKILHTALLVQHDDRVGSRWPLLSAHTTDPTVDADIDPRDIPDDPLLKGFALLSQYMPMRSFDALLIRRSYNYIRNGFVPRPLARRTMPELLATANDEEGFAGQLAGYDMHPFPNLLLLLQGSLPFVPHDPERDTTQGLAGFIWRYSSSVNVRTEVPTPDEESARILDIVTRIQQHLLQPTLYTNKVDAFIDRVRHLATPNEYVVTRQPVPPRISRLGFLLLFGEKRSITVKGRRYDAIVAGTPQAPCRIKKVTKDESVYLEGADRYEAEKTYVETFAESGDGLQLDAPPPPVGYQWVWHYKKKIHLRARLVKSDPVKLTNTIVFSVDGQEFDPFDTAPILRPVPRTKTSRLPPELEDLVSRALYVEPGPSQGPPPDPEPDPYEVNLILRRLSEVGLPLYDWSVLAKRSPLPPTVWKSLLVKLYNNYDNEVHIGPIDSGGHKLLESISYLYEGTFFRLFNLLGALYPQTVVVVPSVKSLKFKINTTTSEYLDMVRRLETLSATTASTDEPGVRPPKRIRIGTPLWPHQQSTSDRILHEMTKMGRRGFGDASNVGAGKTLTALSLLAGLYNHDTDQRQGNGFLVLLPTTYLYRTWEDELQKHTSGFDLVHQKANGELMRVSDPEAPPSAVHIARNTILVTTLGRMRDHPIQHPWIAVVIDECLSVQNKNALQTEEAWRQVLSSQYGCLLMSATFFRSRFDKLFYMLKMLSSGLPENKGYLDAILSECIVSHLPATSREWVTVPHPFPLNATQRKQYDQILRQDLASEKLYIRLQTLLFDEFDFVGAFRDVIRTAQKKGSRCLVYAKSREEADTLASEIDDVGRYPDLTREHVVISYTEGTYGLNNLVHLDTIVTRPPEPDKLPQMKGRLDRPGQRGTRLTIRFLYVSGTIDEASLFRLELANSFRGTYIMPLAEFYEVAVGRRAKEEFRKGIRQGGGDPGSESDPESDPESDSESDSGIFVGTHSIKPTMSEAYRKYRKYKAKYWRLKSQMGGAGLAPPATGPAPTPAMRITLTDRTAGGIVAPTMISKKVIDVNREQETARVKSVDYRRERECTYPLHADQLRELLSVIDTVWVLPSAQGPDDPVYAGKLLHIESKGREWWNGRPSTCIHTAPSVKITADQQRLYDHIVHAVDAVGNDGKN